ncbi:MAG: hypothetical protein EBX55_10100, partial [Betaproteobacteria bacterium]|nr:hypothetical protein [Betaproteobacteria bacterium]
MLLQSRFGCAFEQALLLEQGHASLIRFNTPIWRATARIKASDSELTKPAAALTKVLRPGWAVDVLSAKHHPDVLHRSPARALAQVVKAGDQHSLSMLPMPVDANLHPVAAIGRKSIDTTVFSRCDEFNRRFQSERLESLV